MSIQQEMRKEDKSSPGKSMMELTRDGRFNILTKLKLFQLRERTMTSDSM
jgi:hypothetical protein